MEWGNEGLAGSAGTVLHRECRVLGRDVDNAEAMPKRQKKRDRQTLRYHPPLRSYQTPKKPIWEMAMIESRGNRLGASQNGKGHCLRWLLTIINGGDSTNSTISFHPDEQLAIGYV